MMKTPWIELGKVNGQAVSLDSIVSQDRYDPDWDSNPTGFGPVIVVGGMEYRRRPGCAGNGNDRAWECSDNHNRRRS